MKFMPTRIPDVVLIEPKVFEDARGFFIEVLAVRASSRRLASTPTSSRTTTAARGSGVLRGMHYQIRQPQGKLVRVAQRRSLRRRRRHAPQSSPHFGQWVGELLSAENHRMLWIPPGFAHGFLVLSERADFLYKCTDFYEPSDERTLLWNDPQRRASRGRLPGGQPLVLRQGWRGSPASRVPSAFP